MSGGIATPISGGSIRAKVSIPVRYRGEVPDPFTDGREIVVPAGAIVQFPKGVAHDVRNLGSERCVIMFVKVNPKLLRDHGDG